jgi:hypothetical protein
MKKKRKTDLGRGLFLGDAAEIFLPDLSLAKRKSPAAGIIPGNNPRRATESPEPGKK